MQIPDTARQQEFVRDRDVSEVLIEHAPSLSINGDHNHSSWLCGELHIQRARLSVQPMKQDGGYGSWWLAPARFKTKGLRIPRPTRRTLRIIPREPAHERVEHRWHQSGQHCRGHTERASDPIAWLSLNGRVMAIMSAWMGAPTAAELSSARLMRSSYTGSSSCTAGSTATGSVDWGGRTIWAAAGATRRAMTTNNEATKVRCRMALSAGCRLVLFCKEFTGAAPVTLRSLVRST